MIRFRLKACKKCGGDLALDDGDWICLQCGTYYYVHLYPGARPRPRIAPDTRPLTEKSTVAAQPLGVSHHTMVAASLAAVFQASGAVNK